MPRVIRTPQQVAMSRVVRVLETHQPPRGGSRVLDPPYNYNY